MPAPKKAKIPEPKPSTADDQGRAVQGLANEIRSIAEELRPLWHVERLSDHVSEIASALHSVANAIALAAIAGNGSEADRQLAVETLKGQFEVFRSSPR